MKVMAFVSQKGGSGKTTSLLNLAVLATQSGLKVLVVDLDPQASATVWYRARKAAKNGDAPLVVPTHQAGLGDLLEEARKQGVDWVLIDTAAGTDTTASIAVESADLAIVPCRPSIMDLRAIPNTIRLCRAHNKSPHVILTQIPPKGLDAEARTQLRSIGVDSVLQEGLGQYAAFHHSLIDGRGVVEYEPKGKGAADAQALFRALRKLVDDEQPRGKRSRMRKAG